MSLRNSRGQSLVEYLVIVAIIAIGSIAVIRSLGETIYVRFANITQALQGKESNLQTNEINADEYKKKKFNDFFSGAGN